MVGEIQLHFWKLLETECWYLFFLKNSLSLFVVNDLLTFTLLPSDSAGQLIFSLSRSLFLSLSLVSICYFSFHNVLAVTIFGLQNYYSQPPPPPFNFLSYGLHITTLTSLVFKPSQPSHVKLRKGNVAFPIKNTIIKGGCGEEGKLTKVLFVEWHSSWG